MAQIDAKVLNVSPEVQNLRGLLEQSLIESQATLARHRVRIEMGNEDASVHLDPHLLTRVLRHLLENAANYSPRGSCVVLMARLERNRVVFEVRDEGPGVSAVDLPLIFEKFYRGHQTATKNKGTGMGLAIARALVELHGGAIEATNAAGGGACFRFWIPVASED